jgi:hypothetical protein
MLMHPTFIARLQLTLLGVIGRGSWGMVFKGQWRNLDVAVKTVGGGSGACCVGLAVMLCWC